MILLIFFASLDHVFELAYFPVSGILRKSDKISQRRLEVICGVSPFFLEHVAKAYTIKGFTFLSIVAYYEFFSKYGMASAYSLSSKWLSAATL